MSKLQVGIDIDIQRTRGHIHSAVIKNIDWPNRIVTVQWSEASGLKGKEIDFEDVFVLNPKLCDDANRNQNLSR